MKAVGGAAKPDASGTTATIVVPGNAYDGVLAVGAGPTDPPASRSIGQVSSHDVGGGLTAAAHVEHA